MAGQPPPAQEPEFVVPASAPHPFSSVARAPTLSDTVAEQLTEAIVSKRLRAGERLPSERDLCEKFAVSRTVIREAVRSLAARGLVRVTSGRGVEVSGISSGNVAASMRLLVRGHGNLDYGKVHEVRMAVEVQSAGLAAQRARPEALTRLNALCDAHEQALKDEDLAAASEHDFQFHRELSRAADNELLLAMLDSIADVLREVRHQSLNRPHVSEQGLRAHRRILKAVAAGKPAAARQAMIDHLAEAERVWRGLAARSAKRKVPGRK
jgi:GntR family transcriptional repressor for pyruvate dehydrogenase complex